MKYKALIFDLDGTLWDANNQCTEAWNRVLNRLGYERRISLEEMNSATGKPIDEIIEELLPGIRQEHSDITLLLNEMEKEIIGRSGAYIYSGVKEKLSELSSFYKIFIVSNCQEWYLKEFFRFSCIEKYLSGWNCHGSSGIEKHGMISGIIKKHGIKEAVYIGDTVHDRDSALLCGIDFIHMTYGFGGPIDGAVSFGSFEELYGYLMRSEE